LTGERATVARRDPFSHQREQRPQRDVALSISFTRAPGTQRRAAIAIPRAFPLERVRLTAVNAPHARARESARARAVVPRPRARSSSATLTIVRRENSLGLFPSPPNGHRARLRLTCGAIAESVPRLAARKKKRCKWAKIAARASSRGRTIGRC